MNTKRNYHFDPGIDDVPAYEGDPFVGTRYTMRMNGLQIGTLHRSYAYPGKFLAILTQARFGALRLEIFDGSPFDTLAACFADTVRRMERAITGQPKLGGAQCH